MIRYVDYRGEWQTLKIKAVDQVEKEILNHLEGSVDRSCEVRLDWLARKGWEVCYSHDGGFEYYDMVSLIRYCKKKKIKKMLAISVFFIRNESDSSKARNFNADWTGLCQALWGVGLQNNMQKFDAFNAACVEPFLIVPLGNIICEFLLVRDVSEGVVLAGTKEFIEYMVSRSKSKWYVGNSLKFRPKEKRFMAQKDRKAAIREDKYKINGI
jgi:hypothetical protein